MQIKKITHVIPKSLLFRGIAKTNPLSILFGVKNLSIYSKTIVKKFSLPFKKIDTLFAV